VARPICSRRGRSRWSRSSSLVCAGRDRLGTAAHLFASLGYVGTLIAPMFGVVGDRIGHRDLLAMMRAVYAVLAVTLTTLVLTGTLSRSTSSSSRSDGPGAALRPRRARRTGGHHHAA
jgi:uncharacterized protein YqgC (DUF456 family)